MADKPPFKASWIWAIIRRSRFKRAALPIFAESSQGAVTVQLSLKATCVGGLTPGASEALMGAINAGTFDIAQPLMNSKPLKTFFLPTLVSLLLPLAGWCGAA